MNGLADPYFRSGRGGNYEDHVIGASIYNDMGVWELDGAGGAENYTRMHIWFLQRRDTNLLANRDTSWQDLEQIEANLKQHGFM